MVFPEVQNPTFVTKFIKAITTATPNETLMPDYKAMQKEALYVYIDRYKTILCTLNLSQICNIEFISERIVKILRDLSNCRVCSCINEENIREVQQVKRRECKELDIVSA